MQIHTLHNPMEYSGSQLKSHFICNFVAALLNPDRPVHGDAILVFHGPMKVTPEGHMVDLEDVHNKDPIYSDMALQFIIEHFGCSLELVIYRQLLFMRLVADLIRLFFPKLIIRVKGDDILIMDPKGTKKLSVSIATVSPVSALIHVGINILPVTKEVKAETISLLEMSNGGDSFDFSTALNMGRTIAEKYSEMLKLIDKAKAKVIAVP